MRVLCCAAIASACGLAVATPIDIDFTTDLLGTPLVNGQSLPSPGPYSPLFDMQSAGSNAGLAIFDTSPNGPNKLAEDQDLLVDLGNALILQDSSRSDQTVPGIFDQPDDAVSGEILFRFASEITAVSITLIDIDVDAVDVTLRDSSGFERTYHVPAGWTFDVTNSLNGFDVLNLMSTAPQTGEGGATTTVAEDGAFDPTAVIEIELDVHTSAAFDNIVFIPTPGAAGMALAAVMVATTRRRRG